MGTLLNWYCLSLIFLWILANQPEILEGKANKVNKNGEDNK